VYKPKQLKTLGFLLVYKALSMKHHFAFEQYYFPTSRPRNRPRL